MLNDAVVVSVPERVDVGDVINYTFDVENTGKVTLDNVVVSDPLPGLSAISCNPAQGSTLLPGETMECTASYEITQADIDAGERVNTADVDATDPGENPVNDDDLNTEDVPQAPAIDLTKTVTSVNDAVVEPAGRIDEGDQITYTFDVENIGNVTLDTVELDDALVGYTGFACNDADGILAPGEDTTCVAVYNITQADIDAGSRANTAFVFGNPPQGDPADRSDDATDTESQQ